LFILLFMLIYFCLFYTHTIYIIKKRILFNRAVMIIASFWTMIQDDTEINQKKKDKPRDKVWEHFISIDIPNSSHKGAQCSYCLQT
jgi:hypothetical protein